MSIKTFRIEMRADVTEDGTAALAQLTLQAAQSLRISAMFMNDNRYKVQVVAQVEDSFYNVEDLDLDAEIPETGEAGGS